MRNYAGTRKGINVQLQSSVYLFDISFAIKKFSFCGAIFKSILAWERGISKRQFLESSCSSACNLSLAIYQMYGCENMFLLLSLSKSKFFTRVALVPFVQKSCRTRVVHVALVSLVSHSCCTRFARVWCSCCKLDQIVYIFVYKIFINSIFKSYTAIAMGLHAMAK